MRIAERNLKLLVTGAMLAGSIGLARTAGAQASPIAFGVTAGATKATGDLGDGVDLGYHVGGLLQWSGPSLPFGVRLDGVYHRFSVKDVSGAHANILGGTLNGVFSFPMESGAPVSPYLIGGVGYYHLSASCSECTDSKSLNKFGLNGGGGLSFPLSGFSAFVEARYHYIFSKDDKTGDTNTSMIPISFGIMFHP